MLYTVSVKKSLKKKKTDRWRNVSYTETGYVDLRILHWLPLGAGGTGICPIEMAIMIKWLCWLEGVAELRVVVHHCFLSHLRQTGADFGPQLPAGAGLLPLKVVNHWGGTDRRQNINAHCTSAQWTFFPPASNTKDMINCMINWKRKTEATQLPPPLTNRNTLC